MRPLAWIALGALMASTPLVAQAPTSTPEFNPAPATIVATDADGKRITLNPTGRVTVVFLCTEQSQTEIRDASGKLDGFRGLSKFRVVAVVDLRDSLGNLVEGIVRWRMQEDLDDEAERLTPFYRANANQNDPRPDLCAIPDFTGAICKSLGWPKVSNKLRGVVFGQDGRVLKRWEPLTNYQELYDTVAKGLKG